MAEGPESVQPEEAQLYRLGPYLRFIVLSHVFERKAESVCELH